MNRATTSLTMIAFVALMAGYGFSLHNPYASAQENETATTATNTDPNVLKDQLQAYKTIILMIIQNG